ncbi:TPA: LPXTG cell wall anchor domain-containing protein, partial [Staphylococcus aureus]|nr:LPXTG cell wall anchor domain-containing protein [Staphylococcus aureus]
QPEPQPEPQPESQPEVNSVPTSANTPAEVSSNSVEPSNNMQGQTSETPQAGQATDNGVMVSSEQAPEIQEAPVMNKDNAQVTKKVKQMHKKQSETKTLPKSGQNSMNDGVAIGGIFAMFGSMLAVFGLRKKRQVK